MKQSAKVALSGMLIAVAVVIMIIAWFPYVTYAIPAVSGGVLALIAIEINRKWAFCAYIATSIIIFLIHCEQEAACLFVCFFGYYTILKGYIEQHLRGVLEYIAKFAVFNVAMVAAYLVIVYVIGINPEELGIESTIFAAALLVAGNFVFAVYDVGLNRVIGYYIYALHPRIKRIFK